MLPDQLGLDPVRLVEGLQGAGLYSEYNQKTGTMDVMPGSRGLVYPTLEDRLAAADTLIDDCLQRADQYPYYDLYRQHGLLHEDGDGPPYLVLYRTMSADWSSPETQLAGGLRDGVFRADELTGLQPSVKVGAVRGFEDYAAKFGTLEAEFGPEQVEAYMITDSGHDFSAYLSTAYAPQTQIYGDAIMELHVPACVTLPVDFLYQDVERRYLTSQGVDVPSPSSGVTECEIGVIGRIRPEWIVGQNHISAYRDMAGGAPQ